jgi:non-ribosomal peptide synthetase component F
MARCSFDIHVSDIVGTLIIGATLVMLRPKGNMDFQYLAGVFEEKKITHMVVVPTLLNSFLHYLKDNNRARAVESFRAICVGGEWLTC